MCKQILKDIILARKRGGEGERDGGQHDDERATTVTELAKGNSSSLSVTCKRWLWMESTARGKSGGGPRRIPRNGLRHNRSAGNEA